MLSPISSDLTETMASASAEQAALSCADDVDDQFLGESATASDFLRKKDPDPYFHYDVNAAILSPISSLKGRAVTWHVKGVVPLEDVMYPSLHSLPKDVVSPLASPSKFVQKYKPRAKPSASESRAFFGSNRNKKSKKEEEDYDAEKGLTWTVEVSPVRESYSRSQRTDSPSQVLMKEITNKGEQYLRGTLKHNLCQNMQLHEHKRQTEQAKKTNMLLHVVDPKAARLERLRVKAAPVEKLNTNDAQDEKLEHVSDVVERVIEGEHERLGNETPDALFATLTSHFKKKQSALEGLLGLGGQLQRRDPRYKMQKEGEALSLEESFYRQKTDLSRMASTAEHSELQNGLLYYRVHNDLNAALKDHSSSDLLLDDEIERNSIVRQQRERRDRLLNVLATERATYHSSGTQLTRSMRQQRAMDYQLDYDEDISSFDTQKPLRSFSDADRTNLQISPIKNAPSHSTRVAQDVLLVNQLSSRMLPEIFIKSHEKITSALIKKSIQEEDILNSLSPSDRQQRTQKQREEHGAHAIIDLSSHGVGDEQGLCLGQSLLNYTSLEKLILKENRLSARSIPAILKNIRTTSVLFIDLSENKLHGKVCSKALSRFFKTPNVCKHLNLSKCELTCADVLDLCEGLSSLHHQSLEELVLQQNRIEERGAVGLAAYLARVMTLELDPRCHANKTIGQSLSNVKLLHLGWNTIRAGGAIALAKAILVSKNLKNLDLSANSVTDLAAQQLGAAIKVSTSLEVLNLQQNQVQSPACFVFARVLKDHPSMKVLDLSMNPLGEPGARSIFRTILHGLKCFVMMRTCTFEAAASMFNHSNPAADSPYTLDLTLPYNQTVACVLLDMMAADPEHCKVFNASYVDRPNGTSKQLTFHVVDGRACEKSHNVAWVAPPIGVLQLEFEYLMKIPTETMAMTPHAIFVLQIIIVTARSEADRRNWLRLLCRDVHCTTVQAQGIIDHFLAKQVIGIGGLKRIDVINAVWSRLLDPHNMVEFLANNISDESQRRKMMYGMSLDLFRFNWVNPTGRWRLNLADENQRLTMTKFIAINKIESAFSREKSGREDTSQMEDWSNFRNATYSEYDEGEQEEAVEAAVQSEYDKFVFKPFVLNKEFTDDLPYSGIVEFDYVSTRRPLQEAAKLEEEAAAEATLAENADDAPGFEDLFEANADALGNTTGFEEEANVLDEAIALMESGIGQDKPVDAEAERRTSTSGTPVSREQPFALPAGMAAGRPSFRSGSAHAQRVDSRLAGRKHPRAMLVSEQQMREFLQICELTTRERCGAPDAFFKLAYLQLASTKYYFEAHHVCTVLECFSRDPLIQARAVVALFSRIWDLHNFDVIVRSMSSAAQREVVLRLGYMNIMNPLKPAMDYFIDMRYADSRKALVFCLEVAPSEGGDQLKTDAKSDLTITDMFGSINRVLKNCMDAHVIFNYGEVGERSTHVAWNLRTAGLKRFLLGTLPHPKGLQRVIPLYNKLVKENMLTIGPIEHQYEIMLKRKKEEAEAQKAANKKRFLQGAVKRVASILSDQDLVPQG